MTEAEFVAAYEQHRDEMMRIAARKRGIDAEEVVQQTIVELLKISANFTPSDSEHTRAWMLGALRWRLKDAARAHRRFRDVPPDRLDALHRHRGHAAAVEQNVDLQRVVAALKPDWQDDVRDLLAGWTAKELAAKRGIHQSTYSRRLRRVLEAARIAAQQTPK